jgi:hypothetical protein
VGGVRHPQHTQTETLAFNIQTPGKYPEDNLSLLQNGENLETRRIRATLHKNIYVFIITRSFICRTGKVLGKSCGENCNIYLMTLVDFQSSIFYGR